MADADYDYGDGYGQDRQDAGPAKARRYVNLAGALTSLALVAGLGLWGYKLAVRDVQGVPVIQALDGPMRVSPEDPGGEIVDNQGFAVNDVAAVGAAAPMPEVLVLAPRPVELSDEDMAGLAGAASVDPSLIAAPLPGTGDMTLAAAPPAESASPTEVAIDAALAEALGEAPVEDAAGVLAEVEVVVDSPVVDLANTEPAPEGAITVSPRPKARPAAAAATANAMEATSEAAALTAAIEVDPTTIPVGTRLVQFGAFDSADEARAEWVRLQGQFGELMADKRLVLQPAESGGRTFYRLRAHGFEDEADARRFCTAFVAKAAICIPVPQR
ncbi:Sporulation-like domain containing protein [Paracoccaceae bacterium]